MSQSKKRAPIQLGGMQRGGITTDGDAIGFTLTALDGRVFSFSVPHEAVAEIVDNLLFLAEAAAERRPKLDPQPGELAVVKRAVSMNGVRIGRSADGGDHLYVELNTKGALQRSLQIDRETAQELIDALQNELRRMTN